MWRRPIAKAHGLLALALVLSPALSASAANPRNTYGVLPYGFLYPTDRHIWKDLNIVYGYDMGFRQNWGPNGPGYYSCYNFGGPQAPGPYGCAACGGLTPLHYEPIAPASYAKPYPQQVGQSFYAATPVPYSPIPGWDVPEYPPFVHQTGFSYSSMNGFVVSRNARHMTRGAPLWYTGAPEYEFWGGSQRGGFGAGVGVPTASQPGPTAAGAYVP